MLEVLFQGKDLIPKEYHYPDDINCKVSITAGKGGYGPHHRLATPHCINVWQQKRSFVKQR